MRVNSRVFDEKQDMLGALRIPNCPSEFRVIAENILMMVTRPGYAISDYNTMTELDKNLMWDYWREFDGLMSGKYELMYPSREQAFKASKEWFIKKATAPEMIRRARQYLVERNYLIVKPEVQKRAYEASNKFSKSIKAQ